MQYKRGVAQRTRETANEFCFRTFYDINFKNVVKLRAIETETALRVDDAAKRSSIVQGIHSLFCI